MNIAYKILHKTPKGLLSFMSIREYAVTYTLDKWAFPPAEGNPFLFVFETLEDARKAITFDNGRIIKDHVIYKCEVLNPTKTREFYRDEYRKIFNTDEAKQFIQDESTYVFDERWWPKGTIFVDAVRLMEEMN
jgi:hypothetical protein